MKNKILNELIKLYEEGIFEISKETLDFFEDWLFSRVLTTKRIEDIYSIWKNVLLHIDYKNTKDFQLFCGISNQPVQEVMNFSNNISTEMNEMTTKLIIVTPSTSNVKLYPIKEILLGLYEKKHLENTHLGLYISKFSLKECVCLIQSGNIRILNL